MFTGIIQAIGRIESIDHQGAEGGDQRLGINAGRLDLGDVSLGDSICVNGACLTVTELQQAVFFSDVSVETLSCTALGALQRGSRINLEKAMQLSDRISGHLVSGHVDGVGTVLAMQEDARSVRYVFEVPESLSPYICHKGAICIDGVSLTVNGAGEDRFDVNIIPHTLEETIFSKYKIGTPVNLEVDMIARYLARYWESLREKS